MSYTKIKVLFTNGIEKEYEVNKTEEDTRSFIRDFRDIEIFRTKSYAIRLRDVSSIEFVE